MAEPVRPCSVVIADDDELLVKLLTHKLSQKGMEVASAHDGESGLELISTVQPDLVILDGMMPGMDGLEVLKRLKQDEDTKNIPVIFLSARKMEEDIVTGLNFGADDYLVKPFMPEELFARIKRLLRDKCPD